MMRERGRDPARRIDGYRKCNLEFSSASQDIQFDEKRNSDSSSGKQTLIISDTRDFTVNLSSKLIRQHDGGTIGVRGEGGKGERGRGGDGRQKGPSFMKLRTGSPITTLIVYRRQPNWIS